MLKLNLGSGYSKAEGFINIDTNEICKPDLIHDITKRLPYADAVADEVWLIHVIEHLPKSKHLNLFLEVNRVLDKAGLFILCYPEFTVCAANYINNFRGQRDFWEATIYGRQSTPHDFHVSLMDSEVLIPQLTNLGFYVGRDTQVDAPYYTILRCVKKRNSVLRDTYNYQSAG